MSSPAGECFLVLMIGLKLIKGAKIVGCWSKTASLVERGLLEWYLDGARQAWYPSFDTELGTQAWGSSVWVSRSKLWDSQSFHSE